MTQTTKVAPRTVNRNFAYDVVRDVDVVFAADGVETLDRSWKVLRPGGRLVTNVSVEKAADERGRAAFFIVEPNARQLDEVARLIDAGVIRPIVGKVFRLADARQAYRFKPERGKVVLQVIDKG